MQYLCRDAKFRVSTRFNGFTDKWFIVDFVSQKKGRLTYLSFDFNYCRSKTQ
ncbi:hypothetical protein H1P_2650004 [Hyella patelloides LEGE 07179]|uniref:Uncharacterized protein n=1 Tax=Hyella patelloides LEGE 07179 TaxID=945734 RepID=A0A563VSQ1_9CYAN|nr:hypothetical protein H1P_2650004 [Hyella patelloides LEGE 07179]